MMHPTDYISLEITGIRCALFGPTTLPDNPLVLVIHGRNSCMERQFTYCRELAASGLTALTFNLRNHGDRTVNPSLIRADRTESAIELLSIIRATAFDASLILDFLEPVTGLHPRAFGITGTSLGGTVVAAALQQDTRFRVGASIVGTGSFLELCLHHMRKQNMPEADIQHFLSGPVATMFTRQDPVQHPECFHNRPLMLLSGGNDEQVPHRVIQHFHDTIAPYYTRRNNLQLTCFQELAHDAPAPMRQMAIRWLCQHLTETTP